jgi:hypothetical protein
LERLRAANNAGGCPHVQTFFPFNGDRGLRHRP